jgi:hypothetical protein
MPALNLIPSGIDTLPNNLRDISIHLRELKFQFTPILFEILCPLNEQGKPIAETLYWPYLKTLEIGGLPGFLPSGKDSLFHCLLGHSQ